MPATPEQDAAAEAAINEVRRAYYDGRAAIFAGTSPFGDDSSRDANNGNYSALEQRIVTWQELWRLWATDGHRTDGSYYSWGQWFSYGRDVLGSQITQDIGVAVDPSFFREVAGQTASDVGELLGDAAQVAAHPFKAPLWLWGAGAVVLLVLLAPYVGVFRAR